MKKPAKVDGSGMNKWEAFVRLGLCTAVNVEFLSKTMTTCTLPHADASRHKSFAVTPHCSTLSFVRCPWTGTGIGRNNMLAFRVFVVSVNVLCYFTIGIVIAALVQGVAA